MKVLLKQIIMMAKGSSMLQTGRVFCMKASTKQARDMAKEKNFLGMGMMLPVCHMMAVLRKISTKAEAERSTTIHSPIQHRNGRQHRNGMVSSREARKRGKENFLKSKLCK